MKLHQIISGNEKDLLSKKYSIGVGISLGNKWFTIQNITELVQWSLNYTKDYVIVYVADFIHAINLEIRSRITYEKALERADKMGTSILEEVKVNLEKVLSAEDFEKIKFVKWKDVVDESYQEKVHFLYDKYENDFLFKESIQDIVKNGISKEERLFSKDDINRLGHYLIEEMPEVLSKVKMVGLDCDAYVYPNSGEFVTFIERIQKGEIFSEIKENIIDTEPKIFLEVR